MTSTWVTNSDTGERIVDEAHFIDKNKVDKCNSLMTIIGSVWSTQYKKSFSFKIGVATIFLVSSFVCVILSVAYLQ